MDSPRRTGKKVSLNDADHEVAGPNHAEERIAQLTRVQSILVGVDRAIVHIPGQQELLDEICQVAVDKGGFKLAWVGMVMPDESVQPVAQAGAIGYLDGIRVMAREVPEGRGPVGMAIRENRTVVIEDVDRDPRMAPWHDRALKFGLRYAAAFPIRIADMVTGSFQVYAPRAGFFDDDELKLLTQVSNDISFALTAIDDNTRRRKAEEDLRRSERLFRTLVNTSSQSVWHYQPRGLPIEEIDGASAAWWREFTGQTEAQRTANGGLGWLDAVHEEDREIALSQWKIIETASAPINVKYRVRRRGGGWRWLLIYGAPIQGEQGKFGEWVGTVTDVTERELAERSLAESRLRFKGIVESALDAIISVNSSQRILLFNAAAEKIFRCAAGDAIGSSLSRFIPSHFRAGHGENIRRFGETDVTNRKMGHLVTTSGLRADGTAFPIEASISQAEVAGEKLFTIILRDITERKQLEHEILEISTREQRRIGQDLHDDLCQWLAGTHLLISTLAKDIKNESPAFASRAFEIAGYLRQTVSRARALARGLTPAVIESEGLLGSLRELAANTWDMYHIVCSFNCAGTVEVRDKNAALHLYRIAQEAISNAVRHGGAHEIGILLQPAGDRVSMQISDDGVGNPQTFPQESGMGLRTMRYRAESIGGILEIRPGNRGGTEVICTFPKEL